MKLSLLLLSAFLCASVCNAQILKPGFDADEYLEMLAVSSRQGDSSLRPYRIPAPTQYRRVYRSPLMGLQNRWDLWLRNDDQVAAISIRGTTASQVSWLANFYSAMIPATGTLQLNDSTTFAYRFAADEKAAVHVGWSIALAYLAPSIEQQMQSLYATGVRHFIIMGHSQGGAIAYLLRSYLHYRMQSGRLPADVVIKTYCSAAPKPGNLFYAYDYEFITRTGWSFNVVNALDWVPETPFSIQQTTDFNERNPFSDVGQVLSRQRFVARLYLNHAYGKLRRSTRRAANTYQKYLGKNLYKIVRKTLPQLREPRYAETMNYMRAGSPVVLQPDDAYLQKMKSDSATGVFYHHSLESYRKLLLSGYKK